MQIVAEQSALFRKGILFTKFNAFVLNKVMIALWLKNVMLVESKNALLNVMLRFCCVMFVFAGIVAFPSMLILPLFVVNVVFVKLLFVPWIWIQFCVFVIIVVFVMLFVLAAPINLAVIAEFPCMMLFVSMLLLVTEKNSAVPVLVLLIMLLSR